MALSKAGGQWVKARALIVGAAGLACATVTCAQQMPIGSVSTLDATVTGTSSSANGRAQFSTNGTVVAKDHAAYVQLYRGGSLKLCATSGVHLTAGVPVAVVSAANASGAASTIPPPPLMVALDRGAMELRMPAVPGDIVMTPDLRLSFNGDGQLDVHIRVTRNGDTCVENRVAGMGGHPELRVGSLFGNETYNVLPGQHVLFEGGSLREVVDNEISPCGCPEAPVKPPAAPDLAAKSPPKSPVTPAAEQHPFPAAVSQGLAPPPPVPQAPPRVTHTQVATTLVYAPDSAGAQTNKDAPAPAAAPAPAPAEKKGFFHAIGRFFRRLF